MATGEATEIADELQRLCCAETEGKFFDYVTESVGTICRLLRESDELRERLTAIPFKKDQCSWGMSSKREGECARCASGWVDHIKPAECLLRNDR